MNLLEKLFAGVKAEQPPPQAVDPKQIAEKLAEFTKTRAKVAAETRRQRTGGEEDAPDRPPDVIQGAMAGITASQITQALKGQLKTAGLPPREEAAVRGRPPMPPVMRLPTPAAVGARPWAPEGVEPGTRLEDRLTPRPQAPTGPVPSDPGEPQREGIVARMVDRLKDFGETLKETNAELKRLQIPISEEVKGLTMEQRLERLKAQKALVKPEEAAEAMGGPGAKEWLKPSKKQIVEFSEAQQQKQRQEEIKRRFGEKAARLQEPKAKPGVGASILGAAKAHPVLTAFTAGVAAITMAVRVLQKNARAMEERAKTLQPYSGRIAGAFGKQKMQDLLNTMGLAKATEATVAAGIEATTRRNRALADLRETMGPITNKYWREFATFQASVLETLREIAEKVGIGEAGRRLEMGERAKREPEAIGDGITFAQFYQQMQQAPKRPGFNQAPEHK